VTAPKRKPKSPPTGRNGRNLELERAWEAKRRASRNNLMLHPTDAQLEWLEGKAEPGETPGKTAGRILFSKIAR
jgi:hypothetical protein